MDAQFLGTRKFSRAELAAMFRVPLHMVGDLDRAIFRNIEHQALGFVTHTMLPWAVRWEQELNNDLFGDDDQFFAEFLVQGLMRGDLKSRYESYAIGRNWGWLSANDVRRLENMNSIEDGDRYLEPLNMIAPGAPGGGMPRGASGSPTDDGAAGDDDADDGRPPLALVNGET